MTTIDISSTVMSTVVGLSVSAIVTLIFQYADYKSFKKQTKDQFERIEEHIKYTDTRTTSLEKAHSDLMNVLTKIQEMQIAHDEQDTIIFNQIKDQLATIGRYFELTAKKT